MFESANYLLKTKFTGTVNHLRLIIERYNRNKKIRREMPANDAPLGFCQKLRKERKTMQPNLRVPKVLSTFEMEKTFLTVYESRILIFIHSRKTSTMHAFHLYEMALQFTALLNNFVQPEMSTTQSLLLLKF